MNNINLTGNICNDLELKITNSGKNVCSFNIAVRRPFAKDVTDFFTVVCWNRQAENVCSYCGKGSRIGVSGMLTTRTYQNKEGNNRTAYEIVANEIEFLEKKAEGQSNSNTFDTAISPIPNGFNPIDTDDDLPF